MIQLTFQAALDPFHTVFRFFRLRAALGEKYVIQYDKMRILDFYLVFPFKISDIRLNRSHISYKKLAAIYKDEIPYGKMPDDHVIFERMKPIQWAAAQSMAYEGYYEPERFEQGELANTAKAMPAEIASRIKEINESQHDLIKFLAVLANGYELLGPDGLKARTNLIEYRYDTL